MLSTFAWDLEGVLKYKSYLIFKILPNGIKDFVDGEIC